MQNVVSRPNAVIAIRVSTTKQGTDGDSPEAQREQLIRYAETHNINIRETFIFLESGSKVEQPMQQAINYCKDPKNNVQLFIIKSIDRFTRGGGSPYDQLKLQLERISVSLVDIYGVISTQRVNTLEHLGLQYKWSEYSPSQKTEYLEAERAKDELRDILSRMIGAEVRYARLGYWMRQPPYGFISEKIETHNGKRCILKPHPIEAPLMIKMLGLRAQGTLRDQEIVDELNKLGFKTRVRYQRSEHDRSKVISETGGQPLTVKAMWKLIRNPIYAGINIEKWTDDKPVRCVFKGLVDIDLFNRANKGKFGILENGDNLSTYSEQPPAHLVNKGLRNSDFPYRKFVGCSVCGRPMLGSASRGKNGKYYPAYHCSNHGHYFRVNKDELEASVIEFISQIKVSQEQIDLVVDAVMNEWNKRQKGVTKDIINYDERIKDLQMEAELTVKKIKVLQSDTALKYMEDDLMRIEKEVASLIYEKAKAQTKEPTNVELIVSRVKYFLENMDNLLLKQIDPVKKAQFFGVLFDRTPKYDEINSGNQKTSIFTGLNELFTLAKMEKSLMVTPRRIELLLPG
jgi:hypothetical protein